MTTIMADGINLDVAAIRARFGPGMPVAVPVDGQWAWSPAQDHEFSRKIHYGVLAGRPDWLAARAKIAPHDGTIYCNLSTVPAVVRAVGGVEAVPRWWLAWYWERAGEPTALQVVDELQRLTGTTVPAARVWACQYVTYSQWDLSTVYGPLDWS